MEVQRWLKENNVSFHHCVDCKFISQPPVLSRSYIHDRAPPVIGFLPGGYCGCRSRTPPLHAPPSARLVGAVQQGELSQLLLSDLVVVVLRETKYQHVSFKKKKKKRKKKGKTRTFVFWLQQMLATAANAIKLKWSRRAQETHGAAERWLPDEGYFPLVIFGHKMWERD